MFDGDSMVVDPHGVLLARSPQFIDDLLVVDVDAPVGHGPVDVVLPAVPAAGPATSSVASALSDAREVYLALVTGLRDYVRKNGFRSVVLGMSGGIDSAWWQPSPAMPWATERARRAHAQRVLIGALTVRCRRVRAAHGNEPANGSDQRHGQRLPAQPRPLRPGGREPAGPRARRDPHGDQQRRGPPGPGHPATRASSRWAIPRSTAMRSAASHRSG